MVKDIIPELLKGISFSVALDALGGGQISNQDELIQIVKNVMDQNISVDLQQSHILTLSYLKRKK